MNVARLKKIVTFLADNGYDDVNIELNQYSLFIRGPAPETSNGRFLTELGAYWAEEYECWEIIF